MRKLAGAEGWSLALALVLLLLGDAAAGHYKYSTLSWEQQTGTTVLFTLRSAWSTEFQPYRDQVGGTIHVGDVIRVQGLGDPVLHFGDGRESFQIVRATVTSVDHALQTWVGEAHVAHKYATRHQSNGQPWTAYFAGCCRDSDVRNRHSGYFRVETRVDLSRASYSPIVAALPRQVMLGNTSNKTANSFWVPGFDKGEHPLNVSGGRRYQWTLHSDSPALGDARNLILDPNTGQMWGHLPACQTQAPSAACLYAARVELTDVISGASSEVDFEIESLPNGVVEVPQFEVSSSPGAVRPLPANNTVYRNYRYQWELIFRGQALAPAGLRNSILPLPPNANLSAKSAGNITAGRAVSLLTWQVAPESRWRIICVQTYSNGSQAYRDAQNRSLPVRSRQVCIDIFARSDPPPEFFVSPLNVSEPDVNASSTRAVYMGDQLRLNLTALDTNVVDQVAISHSSLLPVGASLSDPVGAASRRVSRNFTFAPPEKLGGLEGELCFTASDLLRGKGGGGEVEKCIPVRVPKCQYRVGAGQTLLDIAKAYGINWLQLWALNKHISRPEGHGLDGAVQAGDILYVGQLVRVRRGDSLERLAARFGTTLRQIVALNADITPTRPLTTGQLVCLVPSTCADTPPSHPPAHISNDSPYYA